MSNEITYSFALAVVNGVLDSDISLSNKKINQTTKFSADFCQTIGTTYEAIAVPSDVTTPGMFVAVNIDETNFVELGIEHSGSTFVEFTKVLPKHGVLNHFPDGGATLYAKADTASCTVRFFVLDV